MKQDDAISRRTLVKGALAAGVTASVGTAAVGVSRSAFADENDGPASGRSSQLGFLVDVSRCVDCERCIEACRENNGLPDYYANRRWMVTAKNVKDQTRYLSMSCMHCEHPSCAEVCPAGAITKGAGGIVSVNKDRCIGCKYCYQACPFGVPSYNQDGMDKCDCCLGGGVPAGGDPYCVQACIFDALQYGSFEELRRMAGADGQAIEAATNPSYLLV